MKFKVGERVVYTSMPHHRYEILEVHPDRYYVRNIGLDRTFHIIGKTVEYFHESCVLESVYESPLMRALR